MNIKGWKKFQHFKDRRPPWIKLYRDLLDDPEWHELDAEAAKALVSLWLIASENDGALPDVKRLAFRLRTTEAKINQILSSLSHWLEQIDITAISPRYHDDAPETETETETERETDAAHAAPKLSVVPPVPPDEAERKLFQRGNEVLGKNSGGLVKKLLAAKGRIELARAVIETAATKHSPREYVAGALKSAEDGGDGYKIVNGKRVYSW